MEAKNRIMKGKVGMRTPAEYLREPYGRVVVPESDGTFRAEIIEFPGCIAVGDTAAEALSNLEDVASSWLEATIAKGQNVPEPIENVGFSGKLVVRLPKSLHKKAAHMAAREGVSLNQFIVSSVAEQVGAKSSSAGVRQLSLGGGVSVSQRMAEARRVFISNWITNFIEEKTQAQRFTANQSVQALGGIRYVGPAGASHQFVTAGATYQFVISSSSADERGTIVHLPSTWGMESEEHA
jgi:predicted RNase H-like HicB family nuclease